MAHNSLTLVCVGGPADGQRHAILYGQSVIILIQNQELHPVGQPLSVSAPMVKGVYLRERIAVGDDLVEYLRHENITPKQSVEMLLERYRPKERNKL